jgi:hypothetical protein
MSTRPVMWGGLHSFSCWANTPFMAPWPLNHGLPNDTCYESLSNGTSKNKRASCPLKITGRPSDDNDEHLVSSSHTARGSACRIPRKMDDDV